VRGGSGDILASIASQPAGVYSVRRLKANYAGPALKLRRTTGGTQDINYLGATGFTGAPLDTAAASVFCAATTCFWDTWYDQSGLARHLTQASLVDQPQYIASCINGLPCGRHTTGYAGGMSFVGVTIAGPWSVSAVGSYNGTGCYVGAVGGNNLLLVNTGVTLNGAASTTVSGPISPSFIPHTLSGVSNGAASVLRIDGDEYTGTVTVDTTPGNVGFIGVPGTTCDESEMIWWNAYALTTNERAAFQVNQKNYFGTP